MKYKDEDYGYELERQRRIDAQTEADLSYLGVGQKPVIGSDLKDCDKVQRSVHKDPAPHLPFEEDQFQWSQTDKYLAIGMVAVVIGLLIMLGSLS